MCACGCLLLLIVAAGAVWAILHGLWPVAVLLALASAAAAWFGSKSFRQKKSKPS
jgi:membrane protein implicated in regulation of membrane protease activity